MRLAALISGGKDSVYALMQSLTKHDVVCLVNVRASVDSYMYHVPCSEVTQFISEAVDIPIITGISSSHKDEMEVLERILGSIDIDGVVIGAVESNYQMERIKGVCNRLKLHLCSPLWQKGGEGLLRNMSRLMEIIIVQVAADGMDESWLARRLNYTAVDDLVRLNKTYGVHIMGEGGEYETLVLDAPIYRKRISIISCRRNWFEGQFRGFLEIRDLALETK